MMFKMMLGVKRYVLRVACCVRKGLKPLLRGRVGIFLNKEFFSYPAPFNLATRMFLVMGFALFFSACVPIEGLFASPTPIATLISVQAVPSPTQESLAPLLPTPTKIPPMRLTIPTPNAEPLSDWRPPLYPVPWAIAANDHFYFIRPITADEKNWPLQSYRYGGQFFNNVVHTGIDITTDKGTPIIAAGAGTVTWADWGLFSGTSKNKNDPYGQAVAIKHDFGYEGEALYTVYAHMSEIDVVRGQWVEKGERLGLVGDTGHTTGPHLHFEVRLGENDFFNTYNPELWIAPPQGWGVLVGNMMAGDGSPLRHYQLRVTSYETGRIRRIRTYGPKVVNGDAYYQENLVLSDLPAGWYELALMYKEEEDTYDKEFRGRIQIFPGQVSYFTFEGIEGFKYDLPESEGMQAWTPVPTEEE